MREDGIAYQNKDIASKMLAENFKGKSFRVYGLDLPEIRRVLPTNIPAVKANELRLDNIFELADGTAAIVDYESTFRKEDKVKYLNYLTGIANRYLEEGTDCPVLRMVVIYTGDIGRAQVTDVYDIGAVKVAVECAFLSELDPEDIFSRLRKKVEQNERLTDEELMEFIIHPLSYRKREDKQKRIREAVELAVRIGDRGQQLFTLAGLLAFTDKVIDREAADRIRRAIEMTQVAQIFEEEKQAALTQVAQIFEEEKREALRQAAREYEEERQEALRQAAREYEEEKRAALKNESRQVVMRMIRKNYSSEEITSLVPDYSQGDVEALRQEMEAAGEV